MAADQFGGDRQPQPAAALAGAAGKGLEQMLPRLGRQAGAGVGDADQPGLLGLIGPDVDLARGAGGGNRLAGVAHQVGDDAIELFGIGTHLKGGRHVFGKAQVEVAGGQPFAFHDVGDQFGQRKAGQHRCRFLCAAKGQGAFAEVDRAGDRVDQLGGQAPDGRILGHLDPVGKELRGSEDIAQIVADPRHGAAQLRQALLLFQRMGQFGLHGLQRFLGLAQFAHTGRGLDDAPSVFRRGGIGRHLGHQKLDRFHQKHPHREEQEESGGNRDHRREEQDAQPVVDHRHAQRRGVHRHLDQQARVAQRVADHPDDARFGVGQPPQRVEDQGDGRGFAQVECGVDGPRHGRGQDQLPRLVAQENHVVDPGVAQQFLFEIAVDHVIGKQRQRGDLRPFEMAEQVILPEPRHRRDKDQHLRQHDEDGGQDQKSPRERIEHTPPFTAPSVARNVQRA